MNFYNNIHPYYCGIDLHARILYVGILGQKGNIQPVASDVEPRDIIKISFLLPFSPCTHMPKAYLVFNLQG